MMPGPLGGHSWQPMAYSPKTGLVYIPAQEIGNEFIPVATTPVGDGLERRGRKRRHPEHQGLSHRLGSGEAERGMARPLPRDRGTAGR